MLVETPTVTLNDVAEMMLNEIVVEEQGRDSVENEQKDSNGESD